MAVAEPVAPTAWQLLWQPWTNVWRKQQVPKTEASAK